MRSALYQGRVWHKRFRPTEHELAYDVVMVLVDLDELQDLDASLRFFSRRGVNLMAVRDADHLGGGDLKAEVLAILQDNGAGTGGRVRLLCMPRMLGSVFNPLSVYFCEDAEGRLTALLYEVNNTFGERHAYLLPAAGDGPDVEHDCAKTFYVSPFNDLDMHYAFKVTPPTEADGGPLRIAITVTDADGVLLAASFSGVREALGDRSILRAAARHPAQAGKVLLAIHFEALKIWLKGVRMTRKPRPPARPVTAAPFAPPASDVLDADLSA